MKRILALLFAAVLIFAQVSTAAPAETGEEIAVGNPTPLMGEFFTDMWGNVTSDRDVRELIHGYNLVRWDGEQGMFRNDESVVSGMVVTQDAAGDRTFTFALYDDLFYSDGTPITAWDYAFSMLLQISPEMAELGAEPANRTQILGYRDYINGTVPYLSGIRVLDDRTITITVSHEYVPFFYEMALVNVNPYPISVIAPGVTVKDDGNGIYLANEDPEVSEPVFTAELLRQTIMDEETGYKTHPSVVSGPYMLTSWDGETAGFEINPYYKGNAKGEVPSIEKITFRTSDNATMMEQLKNGEYDLLNKVVSKGSIETGMGLMSGEEDGVGVQMASYPRTGMGYIGFMCEKPALKEEAVRKAIAWCLDRHQLVADLTGDYGIRTDGYYGVGQWMYSLVQGTGDQALSAPVNPKDEASHQDYEEKVKALEELTLDTLVDYEADIQTAQTLLDEAGWVTNEAGIREKSVDTGNGAQTLTLDLKMLYPEGNQVLAQSLQENFLPNLSSCGINLTLEPAPVTEIVNQYYGNTERTADLFFLASNFDLVFDPAAFFDEVTDEQGNITGHIWKNVQIEDEALYTAAVEMSRTKPGDVLTYCRHWVEFQKRFNEILPMIPIYSNVYFDFYTSALQNYRIAENISWGDAIIGANIAE